MSTLTYSNTTVWKTYEKVSVRAFLIFAVITFIPFNPEFYKQDFNAGFSVTDYPWRWLDVISQNSPWFFESKEGHNYAGWFITLGITFLAAVVWELFDKRRSNFDNIYNWFYTVIRYQIVLRMSWFAIAKFFPVQMPFPTISQLNTNLGDFTPGKLYWLTTGVAPFFEVFAGIFELTATILLLFRRTTTLGAIMMIAILLPIWFVNIGYNAGVELASMHILVLSVVLLVRDAPKFWQILILHKNGALTYVQPFVFTANWKRNTGLTVKVAFIFLFLIYRGYEYGQLYAAGKTFKLPLDTGVQSLAGFYNVAEFKLNNKPVPYSLADTNRWQNVIFEKFNSISIKVNRKQTVYNTNKVRTTEFYGTIGRVYYGYHIDTAKKVFYLNNRADTASKLILHYTKTNSSGLILSGVNEYKDSVFVVLNKTDKHYLLSTGK
ncbi:hypothetical protein [Mucilaginibacter sp. SP1R1]|uniref:hypothetical protein n=1 Tax=Mucilaginibacter sp. SP1R1 TaxID=2723091 RepID=UPI00160AC8FE|nr:hypothetical protein [Mucilaginibacter sp. SP1R1]MBB6149006.1 putative membrane protein YphA (DoxX/SURF4 family) [Mucilaginibacter sp. SP1R1]